MEEQWSMPEWMMQYCDSVLLGNDKEAVERLVNDTTPVQINAPLALHACDIRGRVAALESLHNEDKI